MNIKFLSYSNNHDYSFSAAKEMTLRHFSSDSNDEYESYYNIEILFGAVDKALGTSDVIILSVDTAVYQSFKGTLLEALGLTPSVSAGIKLALANSLLSDEEINSHSTIPSGSSALVSLDGMYSGFYIESEGQYIVLLPLDTDRLGYIFENSVFPFVSSEEHLEEPDETEEESFSPGYYTAAKETASVLRENYLKVAIPTTAAAHYFKKLLKSTENYEELFRFTPHIEDSSGKNPGEYAAQIAKIAREFAGTDIGASISNIYENINENGENESCIFICVTDEHKAIVRKLYANPGESEANLLIEGSAELLALIKKTSADIAAVKKALYKDTSGDDGEYDEADESRLEDDDDSDFTQVGTISKKGVTVTIIIIVLALIVSILLGLKFTGIFGDFSLFGKDKTTQAASDSTGQSLPAFITQNPNQLITGVDANESLSIGETANLTNPTVTKAESITKSGNTTTTKKRTSSGSSSSSNKNTSASSTVKETAATTTTTEKTTTTEATTEKVTESVNAQAE